jgi:hypothetical protein
MSDIMLMITNQQMSEMRERAADREEERQERRMRMEEQREERRMQMNMQQQFMLSMMMMMSGRTTVNAHPLIPPMDLPTDGILRERNQEGKEGENEDEDIINGKTGE